MAQPKPLGMEILMRHFFKNKKIDAVIACGDYLELIKSQVPLVKK